MSATLDLKIARADACLRRACLALALTGAVGLTPATGLAQAASSATWEHDMLAHGLGHAPLRLSGEAERLEFSPRARARLKSSERPTPRPQGMQAEDEDEAASGDTRQAEVAAGGRGAGERADDGVTKDEPTVADAEFAKTQGKKTQGPAPSPEAVEAPEQAPAAPDWVPLSTRDILTSEFPRLRRESLAVISRSDATAEDYLEHARRLLGGMFLHEAHHALALARGGSGRNAHSLQARAGEIEAAIEGLEGPAPAAVADARGALWSVLQDHARGERASAARIRAAAADFGNQSGAVVNAALPLLLRAAIAASEADIAAELIRAGVETGALVGSQRLLLEGRLASLTGDDQAAFDHYAAAMESVDAAGIEARIALFDLAMAQGRAETWPQLREILAQGIAQWRNDDLARQLMVRLAAVTEDIGDRAAALSVMAMLMVEYPESGEAELARRRVPLLLSQLAAQARDKEIDLESYIVTLRDLHEPLHADLHWVPARRELAEILAAEGLLLAAAAELGAIEADIAAGSPVADGMAGEVGLRRSELLMRAGRLGEAKSALAVQGAHRLPGVAARHAELKLQLDALSRSPVSSAAEAEPVEPALAMARAAALSGRHDEAVRLYADHAVGDNDLPPSDFARYILAMAATGQIPKMELAEGASEVANGQAMLAAGMSIARPPAALSPLSSADAKDVLSRSGEALDAIAIMLGKKPAPSAE